MASRWTARLAKMSEEERTAYISAERARNKAWREQNAERLKQRPKKSHKERIAAMSADELKQFRIRRRIATTKWRRANPEEANATKQRYMASEKGIANVKRLAEQRRLQQIQQPVVNRISVHTDPLWSSVWCMVNSAYSHHDRHDITSGAIVLLLEQPELSHQQAVQLASRMHWRIHSKFRDLSLDATMPGTDGLRLIDTIAA